MKLANPKVLTYSFKSMHIKLYFHLPKAEISFKAWMRLDASFASFFADMEFK